MFETFTVQRDLLVNVDQDNTYDTNFYFYVYKDRQVNKYTV